jgi:hypothetical protein
MKTGPIALTAMLLASGPSSAAGTLEDFSYQAGSDLGRAIYCQEPSASAFARLAETHIFRRAPTSRHWRAAVSLYQDAAWVRAEYGPITESCEDFLQDYDVALRSLRQQAGSGTSR